MLRNFFLGPKRAHGPNDERLGAKERAHVVANQFLRARYDSGPIVALIVQSLAWVAHKQIKHKRPPQTKHVEHNEFRVCGPIDTDTAIVYAVTAPHRQRKASVQPNKMAVELEDLAPIRLLSIGFQITSKLARQLRSRRVCFFHFEASMIHVQVRKSRSFSFF